MIHERCGTYSGEIKPFISFSLLALRFSSISLCDLICLDGQWACRLGINSWRLRLDVLGSFQASRGWRHGASDLEYSTKYSAGLNPYLFFFFFMFVALLPYLPIMGSTVNAPLRRVFHISAIWPYTCLEFLDLTYSNCVQYECTHRPFFGGFLKIAVFQHVQRLRVDRYLVLSAPRHRDCY